MRKAFKALAAVAVLAPTVCGAQIHADTYNGATCIPYPAFNAANAVPYSSWLYGFRHSAYCHFPIPSGRSVGELSFVFFLGSSPSSAPVRVRLCVYHRMTTSCGAEQTMTGWDAAGWVLPPSPMPSFASGAYLAVGFPNGVSTLQQFIPVFGH